MGHLVGFHPAGQRGKTEQRRSGRSEGHREAILSIREQERRQRQVQKRIDERMRRSDREIRGAMEERSRQADLRAAEIVRRIEKGDTDPRPLPGIREDSLESMESMKSMGSSPSMESTPSAEPVLEVSADAEAREMGKDMPLDDYVPYNAAEAEEDLARRFTEDTGGHGDPHAHNERKADEISRQMTDDTGAEGDMTRHAEVKVDQMGREMFEE